VFSVTTNVTDKIKQHRCKANRQLQPQQTHLFNGLLSGTTQVSRYKEGKTNLDCTEARDSNSSGIRWAICKSAPRSRHITNARTPPLSFLQARCAPCHPTNSVKALKAATTWLRKKTVNIWALYSQPHWYFNFCTTGHKSACSVHNSIPLLWRLTALTNASLWGCLDACFCLLCPAPGDCSSRRHRSHTQLHTAMTQIQLALFTEAMTVTYYITDTIRRYHWYFAGQHDNN